MINILNKYKIVIIAIVTFLVLLTVVKQCEQEPKIVTKTVTKTETKTDTIIKVQIKEVPKIVYINKYIDVKGDKVIVYVDKPTDSSTIKANQYDTEIKSNNATAKLKITTSGELLDVTGVIEYPKETVTTTINKTSAKSGLFIYASAPINNNNLNIEVGGMYQFKNTLLLLGGVQYNQFTKGLDAKIGLGIKIF
jgi:hypothetical protein